MTLPSSSEVAEKIGNRIWNEVDHLDIGDEAVTIIANEIDSIRQSDLSASMKICDDATKEVYAAARAEALNQLLDWLNSQEQCLDKKCSHHYLEMCVETKIHALLHPERRS